MLDLKQLVNRIYKGKECVGFDFELTNEKGEQLLEARYALIGENEWQMRIVFDRTRDADSQVYTFGYVMPKSGLPLTLIAATGLRYFQLYLKEEIRTKQMIDFSIGTVTEGI